ncbi:hypothetical protein [Pseudogemmobacter sp. W21_MBD1_M6]|uniref:hypothetical protein n=1 Tax=Pseudogemmobacter sp. W21_MBD1_M6 TaxID=3240271 RepID=UPI003F98FDCF
MPLLDGSLDDWTADKRLDVPGTGAAGFALYGDLIGDVFYFAISSDTAVIGTNTTIWLDSDLNRATGYQIWGFAGGAEYNINFAPDGSVNLYTGADGQTFVAALEFAYNSTLTAVEIALPQSLMANSPTALRVFADVNNSVFIPNDYSNNNFIIQNLPIVSQGAITLDGDLGDWGAATRLDTVATGTAGYGIYGDVQGDAYVFAISSDTVPIGANTTIWLDTDIDRSTGYQIWGFTGGVEYNVNFTADGTANLYTGAAGQTFVAALDYKYNADRSVVELVIPKALIAGSPDVVRIFADVNDSAFLPNDYANVDILVGTPPVVDLPTVTLGTVTLDGSLADWATGTRLDTLATGAAGYGIYGDVQGGAFVFALSSDSVKIGSNTTIWLDTDMDRGTGYQIWGFTGGAEYNINFTADGKANLYTGGAGETLIAALDYRYNADHTVVELAVAKDLLAGAPDMIRIFADVNNAVFVPNDYANVNFFVGSAPLVTYGAVTLDGVLNDWDLAATRLDTAATGTDGFGFYGDVQGNAFVFALTADAVAIGGNTTIWLDTDLNRATGHQIFGLTGGAEYNINIAADGQVGLYTGDAGQTFVSALDFHYNADKSVIEIAVAKDLMAGSPDAVRVYADVNNAVFLPGDYATTDIFVSSPTIPVEANPALRVAIVYSETSANNFYDKTAYGQLFLSAQNQAMQGGIPFDVLSEADLLDVANLTGYDAIVFPGFSNVESANLAAITEALTLATQVYGVGLIAAGNFMTNDETGAAIAGDSYARMKALLGVTLDGFGTTQGFDLVALDGTNPILDGYGTGELVGTYANISYQRFSDVTNAGEVLFNQIVSADGVTSDAYAAAIATTTAARNVHFSSDAVMGNTNILGEAIDWVVNGDAVDVSLAMTRGTSLFYSRTDMDQSQEVYDVQEQTPGIYDALLPILQNWYDTYGFVGSYYINIGANPPDQTTDWSISKPYYDQLLALENEIGTHSWTHPEDTNLLIADTPELLAILAKVNPANPNAVDPWTLSNAEQALLLTSFTFQFDYSKLKIEQELGITITGTAVPGAPEKLDASQQIIQFFNYMSGGYSGTGAGYPGGFGFLTPELTDKVYLAPNMSFDFSLVGFQGLTAAEAALVWAAEYAEITTHGTTPIIAFPWHDYGPTNWNLGDAVQLNYNLQMFEAVIAQAAADGAEFVTGAELASRIASFAASDLSVTQAGNVITATVGSSDAGSFALTIGDGATTIASVADWYAYDDNQVFLPASGGTFQITTGPVAVDVTHLTLLPMRGDLLSVSGDGSNLEFAFNGKGNVVVDLRAQGTDAVVITGADGGSVNGDLVTLAFDTLADHAVSLGYTTGATVVGSAGSDVILGGSGADRIEGGTGNDTMNGGAGADTFVFVPTTGQDIILDFATGVDQVEFGAFDFASTTIAETTEGLLMSFATGDTLLFAGLTATGVNDTTDFIYQDIPLV